MRQLLLLIISISILSCNTKNSKKVEVVKTDIIKAVSIDTIIPGKESVKVNECGCIDYAFSQKEEPPLLTHKIGNSKITVCGYRGEYEDKITLGEILPDSSFYASGFVVFNCSGSEPTSIFMDGEYYLDLIKPKLEELEIVRLMKMPRDTSLKYEWTEVLSIRVFEQNGLIKTDSSFVLPVNSYNQDFLKHFKSEIDRMKNDTKGKINYPDYLIDYYFIQAVKNPEKYSKKFKSIGPFDGYLGPIYRDALKYYELFEKENTVGNKS
ncbi:hypothetical protein N9H19_02330 [Flavobacteriales bacterium]|nr:hypothetical protein [Flavobacteriales bacterium]